MRDTLPLCLGLNCLLGKERAGLDALDEARHCTDLTTGVNGPPHTSSTFFTDSGGMNSGRNPKASVFCLTTFATIPRPRRCVNTNLPGFADLF